MSKILIVDDNDDLRYLLKLMLAITAYASKAETIIEAGAREVIQKPMRKKTILNKTKKYLDNEV